jgi:integrase/recombinase XerD
MIDAEVTPPTYNARIMAQRFLFGTTCDREEIKRYMQFRTQPRRLLTVLSIEEVSEVIAAPPPRAGAQISLGAQHFVWSGFESVRGLQSQG